MRKTAITQGRDDSDGAFCLETLEAQGIKHATLMKALSASLRPFAALLKPGHGVAVILDEDGGASVIGIAQ